MCTLIVTQPAVTDSQKLAYSYQNLTENLHTQFHTIIFYVSCLHVLDIYIMDLDVDNVDVLEATL